MLASPVSFDGEAPAYSGLARPAVDLANQSWQSAYGEEHYSKLRAVKTKYDPDGLFIVHLGVRSEDWSVDGFQRW